MKKTISLILLISSSFLFYIGCKTQAQENTKAKTVRVKMADVISTQLQVPIKTSGVLAAKEEVLLSFKTGGVIKNIFVDAGQKVKKGQLLAQLDLAEISSYREQAESALAKAKRDMVRIENLYSEKVVTLEQKQNVQTALKVAKANAKIATFNEQHSKIYAPANGKVLTRFAEKNELASPGHPILAFGNTNDASVLKVGVSDRDLVRLKLGDTASIEFDAFPDKIFEASVSQIAAGASKGSGTFEVELQLNPTTNNLYSGFIGKAKILPQKSEIVNLIPIESLLDASGKTGYVFKVDANNIAQKQEVQISYLFDEQVAISSGLEGVERIASEGSSYLTTGSAVTIVK